MTITLTKNKLLIGAYIWECLFLLVSDLHLNMFQLQNIIGILTLLLLPGLLTLVLLRLRAPALWSSIGFAVGFSVLELMVMGLFSNTFAPYWGFVRPLDKPVLLIEFVLLINTLIALIWVLNDGIEPFTLTTRLFTTARDWAFAFFPIIFVAAAVAGSVILNNGGEGSVVLYMLGGIGIYAALLLWKGTKLDQNVMPTGLFFTSLALLLMTSLRGWYITGHDIQWEYQVFQLTKSAGLWDMAAYRDAYNACLSITILPTIFANLLSLPDPYIFKIVFQIIFAVMPVMVYLFARRFLSMRSALLAALYFIAFPTFSADMPFLTRQEIAFLLYGLMFSVMFDASLSVRMRRSIFILMGIGVILSHYSTTYTVLFVLGLSAVATPIAGMIFAALQRWGWFAQTALVAHTDDQGKRRARITITTVIILAIFSFGWTVLITKSGGNAKEVLQDSITSIKSGFSGGRSSDALSLITSKRPSQAEGLALYRDTVALPLREKEKAAYIDTTALAKNPLKPAPTQLLPMTTLGHFLERQGMHPVQFVSTMGGLLARIIELLIPLGLLAVLFRKKVTGAIDFELYLLAICSLLFTGLTVLIPVLSKEYGVFRALQQSLLIVGPFIVIGSMALMSLVLWGARLLLSRLPRVFAFTTHLIHTLPAVLAVVFFLYSTSFIPSAIGNNPPQLYLANNGVYYDYYYTHGGDIAAIAWLQQVYRRYEVRNLKNEFELQADRASQNKIASQSTVPYSHGIFPFIVKQDSYVYLDEMTSERNRGAIGYNSDILLYTYPIGLLDASKNLVYSNSSVKIYK